jgi:dimethylglycine dehydrogenase
MELITVDEAHKLFPLLDKRHFVGAPVQPARGARRSRRRHPCVREGGAQSRSRSPSVHSRRGARRAAGPHMGRRHREGDDQRRTRRQCRGTLGARGRQDGRARVAGARDGAPVRDHRRSSRGRVVLSRDAARDRLRGRDLHAPGRSRHADRHVREAGVPWSEHDTPWNFTHELLPPDLDRIAPSLEVGFATSPRWSARASSA